MRSWLAIPICGVVTAGVGLAVGGLGLGLVLGLAGAAMTAALRALLGDSPAALGAAVIAAAIVAVILLDRGLLAPRGLLAAAAFAWTIAELARGLANPTGSAPVVAMLPALIAGILDASLIALVPIAGARLVVAPWRRPRWILAVPVAGIVAVVLAVLACASTSGTLGRLGDAWTARPAAPIAPPVLAALLAEVLGPFVVVAALAGLASVVGRARHAQLALVAAIAGVLLVDLRAGSIGASTVATAALFAGLAIARLASMIRIPAGQAIVAATVGLLVLLPPAWTAIADRSAGRASPTATFH